MKSAKKSTASKNNKTAAKKSANQVRKTGEKSFSRIVQTDVPAYPLDKAITVPQMIADHFARKPVSPLKLASAMKVQPTSPAFRMLTGASIAYGLTKGGWNAKQVEIAPLGLRVVHLTKEGDDVLAKREAILKPRVFGSFLETYNNHPFPRNDIAINVLKDLGVPDDRAQRALNMMLESAKAVGFITTINGKDYVSLEGPHPSTLEGGLPDTETAETELSETEADTERGAPVGHVKGGDEPKAQHAQGGMPNSSNTNVRVFVTHGKNTQFVELVKKFIRFAKLEPIVTAERQSVAKPVPDKVMDDMRSCGGAIIQVDAERTLIDPEGKEHVVLNPNVLIEIGAAFALYGRRFILLVKDGVQLPSNLQGLYEVRYTGDILDGNTTMKLLEAITDMQDQALPDRYGSSE